jgi:threonine dehydrogenase-like Zn-dependent dehydrogenase/DNA-directed RNA polymerase specialized sigma24 family protein
MHQYSTMGAALSRDLAEQRFARLYRDNARRILGYALRRCLDPEDAADVVAETFFAAWRRLSEVPLGEEGRLWLYGTARLVVANQRRGERRRTRLNEHLRAELSRQVPVETTEDPKGALVEALTALEEPDRELLMLGAPWRSRTFAACRLSPTHGLDNGCPVSTWKDRSSHLTPGPCFCEGANERDLEEPMKATVLHGAGDVRVEHVPDAKIEEPSDALIRITRACICGSDLWPYKSLDPSEGARVMGHEAIGVVEDVGAEVSAVKPGDLVVMPFATSDGTCIFCEEGLQTECVHAGFFGNGEEGLGGAQAEALRIPQADGTLYALPADPDEALLPSLLTLADVMGTGHHAAVTSAVGPGKSVAVVGDGAVGLCGVIAAKRLGAEQIIILGRHTDRTDLAREFGATEVVAERGEEAVERLRELTSGFGAHSVLECVGSNQPTQTAIEIARPGGAVGRVGVPQGEAMPGGQASFYGNIRIAGGPAPVRAYIDELLPDILDGTIEPGRVFNRTVGLDEVPDGYRAMNDREALKVMVRP